jgi:lipoprotein-anchoring transpeptidase ErfK/SrfK
MALSRRALISSALAAGLPLGRRAEASEPFPVFASDGSAIPYKFHRQEVDYATPEQPGAIVIDPAQRFLFHVTGQGRAVRYGVSVGKYGNWSGATVIGKMVKWPVWTPTPDHLKRRPELVKYINGMPGGPHNPMGARALYLYQNGADTSYRIHGTDNAAFIGTKATAGCFGMLNFDVIELYNQVQLGTRVVVLPT